MGHVTIYDQDSSSSKLIPNQGVATLTLDSDATAQVAEATQRGSGEFLIRVWGPGQVHAQGGDNNNALQLVIGFDGPNAVLRSVFYHSEGAGVRG